MTAFTRGNALPRNRQTVFSWQGANMSVQLFLHRLPEPERQQDLMGYVLKPGKPAAPLQFKRGGLQRNSFCQQRAERKSPAHISKGVAYGYGSFSGLRRATCRASNSTPRCPSALAR